MVTLKVYDILGNVVKTLVNQYQSQGKHDINFSAIGGSASGGNASNLESGIYFYRLSVVNPANQSENYIATKKMLMIK